MLFDGLKVLVTGGAGFIGSHIVDDLVMNGAEVIVLDNFSSGKYDNLEMVSDKISIVEGDILDGDTLFELTKSIDLISHHAAQLEITSCIDDPIEDLRVNAEGTLRVFEAARANNVKKVIYASSACVYGQAEYELQDEGHPKTPNWPYGVSKYATELYADIYQKYYGIQMVGLRYAIIYGPREWYGRVITAFLRRAMDGEPPVVWGGSQKRDFTYVSDAVNLHQKCIQKQFPKAEVFNVSTGIGTTISELAEKIRENFGIQHKTIFEDLEENMMSDFYGGRIRLPSELQHMQLSNLKAKEELNWRHEVKLEEGLNLEFEWLQSNLEKWKKMSY